ncbi:MAG TPA: hypothetical protein VI759_06780 [Dehalococcoidia bacterium]|nr:hypothetical protein [Dehalococcoidia bacterium]
MTREYEYAVRLFLAWLNEKYHREFALDDGQTGKLANGQDVWHAEDPAGGAFDLACAELSEGDAAWDERRAALCSRLDEARPGAYLLWVPPGADLPEGEPDESEWVRRVVLAASKIASGRSTEVRLPVRLMLGKVREEGGYASVTGGLGRHWTDISSRTNGSFYLDSRGLNRFTRDEEERTQLYDHIGLLSQGLAVGDAMEFEHEDAWSLQRLPRGAAAEGMADGWAITGCPPGFEPEDGGVLRKLLRRRLAEAKEALANASGTRALVLIGAYDYMEYEIAGPSLRGFDPSLAAPFDVIALLADAELKPLRLSRLPFAVDASAT